MKLLASKQTATEPFLKMMRYIHHKGGFICGGFPRYLASPRRCWDFNDIDIFTDEKHKAGVIEAAKSMKTKTGDVNVHVFESPLVYSQNRVLESYTTSYVRWNYNTFPVKLQISVLNESINEPEDVLDTFDFSICRACLLPDGKVLVDDDFYEHEKNRQLVIRNNGDKNFSEKEDKYSFIRFTKYVMAKNYDMTNVEFMKFLGYLHNKDWFIEKLIHTDKNLLKKKSFYKALNLTRLTV